VELILHFKELRQEHCADLATANDAYFEVWQLLPCWQVSHRDLVSIHLLLALVDERVLVENELIEDACIVYALEHYDVPHYFTCHESVLHFLIWDEVVQPVFTELRDSTHLEEVGRLHVSPDISSFVH